jgi:hypothetical protein
MGGIGRHAAAVALLGLLLLTSQRGAGAQGIGAGITNPVGVGLKPGPWKPDIQMPIPEKTEPTIYMSPYTVYRPKIEFHTKGNTHARQSASPAAAAASAAAAAVARPTACMLGGAAAPSTGRACCGSG